MIAVVGDDPNAAAQVALSLAHSRARRQRVTIIDLTSGASALNPLFSSEDPHGVFDCFAYGVSFAAATHPTKEANIFVIPRGTEPLTDPTIAASGRWDRLIETSRTAGTLLIWLVPPDLPGVDAVIARVDRVIPADSAAGATLPPTWAAKRARPAGWQPYAPSRRRRIAMGVIAVVLIGVVGWIILHALRSNPNSDSDLTPLPATPPPAQTGDTGLPAHANATPAPPASTPAATPRGTFIVQFTATRNRDTARAVAARVHVPGATARIVSETKGGRPLYRVIIGPYPTEAAADSVGRAAHTSFFVRPENP